MFELTCRLWENHIKLCWNWVMRLCLRGKHTLKSSLGHMAYSYWAKRRALYSALFSTIIFHALQDSLKLWISNKRSPVSNANYAPISAFASPTNMFGTNTFNCTSRSRYNTSGSITWDWRDLPQSEIRPRAKTFTQTLHKLWNVAESSRGIH
jgi:hypothetical protein